MLSTTPEAVAQQKVRQSREANSSKASVSGAAWPRRARKMDRYGNPEGTEGRRGGTIRRRAWARRVSGMLRVIGYEMKAGCELPQPATLPLELAA